MSTHSVITASDPGAAAGDAAKSTGVVPSRARSRSARRPGAGGRGSGRRSRATTSPLVTRLALVPALVLLAVFVLGAIVQTVRISTTDWVGFGPMHSVGLDNYRTVLKSSDTYQSLGVTLVYAAASAVATIVISSLLAAAVSHGVKGGRFYRVIWFLPGVAPAAAVSIFWTASFQPRSGGVNQVLGHIGLGNAHAWLGDASTAVWPVVFVTVWAGVGFAFLLLLGAMEQVPVSIYEAARIDGASTARQFFSMTLPMIRPVFVMTALLEFMWAFNGFTTVWAMTQGGPGTATSILPVRIYREALLKGQFGPASALAVLSAVVLIAVGLVGVRASRSKEA
ncbi:carbohydrate ABC transporter permease [Streptomyces bottropensis]|uniref:carbohydrate ABC transporter permease n=1 Tax=Streptomyces bottropensis TaxID=42235 RepID=UPI0036782AAF